MGSSFALNRYFTEERIEQIRQWATAAAITLGIVCLFMLAQEVLAGSGGTAADEKGKEFAKVWETLEEWTKGTLGRIIAIAFVIIGSVAGAARQSLMAFAIGIAAALGLYNAPALITNVFGATLPVIGG